MVASLLTGMMWRSALKSFLPIAPDLVNIKPVLESVRWSPSSFGAQPYNIHVVTDKKLKEELREVSYNQPQVSECSHLLVFCARTDPKESIERFIKYCDIDTAAPPYASSLRNFGSSMQNEDEFKAWSTNQAFLALGIAVAAAADSRIGSCPMGGFVPADVHRVLKLPTNQWPVAYLAVGSELDPPSDPQRYKRFRLPSDELFQWH